MCCLSLLIRAADLLCGKGSDSRPEVGNLTATPLLAWMWEQLEGGSSSSGGGGSSAGSLSALSSAPGAAPATQPSNTIEPSPLATFWAWVEAQEVAGFLEFEVKADGGSGTSNIVAGPALAPAQVTQLSSSAKRR